jgi:type II secretion system (T2SS) protein E
MRLVRQNQPFGVRTATDRPAAAGLGHESLPPPPTVHEEAVLIAERLAALVESRRVRPSPAPVAAPQPTRTPTSGVVGARHSGRLLGNLLVTRGFIVEGELNYALARQASTGDPIGEILVELGLITDRDLVELLAEQLRMHVVDLSRVDCDPDVLALLSKTEARRRAALPLRRVHGLIEVAVAEPTDDAAVAELMTMLGVPLRLFLATRADIVAAVERFYG